MFNHIIHYVYVTRQVKLYFLKKKIEKRSTTKKILIMKRVLQQQHGRYTTTIQHVLYIYYNNSQYTHACIYYVCTFVYRRQLPRRHHRRLFAPCYVEKQMYLPRPNVNIGAQC